MAGWKIVLTAVVLMTSVAPALAQGPGRASGVYDVLTDILGLNRTVQGHVVQHREGTLILRGEDARTYTINSAGLDLTTLRSLRDGRPVTVTLKSSPDGGMPVAASLKHAEGPAKVFRRVEGTVDAVTDDRITFTTHGGNILTLDRARIIGEALHVAPNETATLVYEQEPRLAGVWIESREVQPAAAPRGER